MTLIIKPTLRHDTATGETETWYEVLDEAYNIIVCKDTRKGAEAVVRELERGDVETRGQRQEPSYMVAWETDEADHFEVFGTYEAAYAQFKGLATAFSFVVLADVSLAHKGAIPRPQHDFTE